VPPLLPQHVCHKHLRYRPRRATKGLRESVPCSSNVSRERDPREQQRMAVLYNRVEKQR